jgi:competence protein ComEA
MSFYRNILVALTAFVFASPLFADEAKTLASPANVKPAMAATATPAATTTTVNVNTATAKELAKVKGLNPAKARAIVKYRKKHGDFKSIDGLESVKALKKLKADDLKAIEAQLSV